MGSGFKVWFGPGDDDDLFVFTHLVTSHSVTPDCHMCDSPQEGEDGDIIDIIFLSYFKMLFSYAFD